MIKLSPTPYTIYVNMGLISKKDIIMKNFIAIICLTSLSGCISYDPNFVALMGQLRPESLCTELDRDSFVVQREMKIQGVQCKD